MAVSEKSVLEVPRVVCLSGILGIRLFWKVSCLSRGLLELRADSSSLGLGSVRLGFCSVSEREELARLLDDCLVRDDLPTLKRLLAVEGVSAQFPFLLTRALERYPSKERCIEFLSANWGTGGICSALSVDAVSGLTKESLASLIKGGVMKADSWVQHTHRRLMTISLLSVLIGCGKFECAEMALDQGARVEVCDSTSEWGVRRDHQVCFGWGPLQVLVVVLVLGRTVYGRGKGRFMSPDERERGFSLLRRVARAAKASGCLDWRVRVGMVGSLAGRCRRMRDEWADLSDSVEHTALGIACLSAEAEVVEVLLEAAKSEEGKGLSGRYEDLMSLAVSPEHWEARGRWKAEIEMDTSVALIVEQLGNFGFDLNREIVDKGTPLLEVCSKGWVKSAEALLEKGVSARGVTVRGRGGVPLECVPLLEALSSGSESSLPLVTLLLKAGADPNEPGVVRESDRIDRRNSPLATAIHMFHSKTASASTHATETVWPFLQALVEHGATCGEESTESPLLLACLFKDAELIRFLCKKAGANPRAVGKICTPSMKFAPRLFDSMPPSYSCDPLSFIFESVGSLAEWTKEGVEVQWGLVKTLVEMGGEPETELAGCDFRSLPSPASRCSSGFSRLANLISLVKECRGPLLLQLIRVLPLTALQEQVSFRRLGQAGLDPCPLAAALKVQWREGVEAMLERGVCVNRLSLSRLSNMSVRHNEDLHSPLRIALETGQKEIAAVLLERGARLSPADERWVLPSSVPADLAAMVNERRKSGDATTKKQSKSPPTKTSSSCGDAVSRVSIRPWKP